VIRGRIVLVPFPFDDLSSSKVRPAVCLTEPLGTHRHVVLAFISSQPPSERLDSDVAFDPGDADFAATGLRVASTLRLHRLMTVASSLIRRDLGALSPRLQALVSTRLRDLFSL
jgi:mRNA interferase MazF